MKWLRFYIKKIFIWCSYFSWKHRHWKYGYSGYGTGFDRRSSISFPGCRLDQNVLIIGADMSSFAHIDNKKKDILVIGKYDDYNRH